MQVRRSKIRRLGILFICLICSLLLSGCVTIYDAETSFDYTGDIVATIDANTTVGQTFISRRPGFNSIQLWLRKGSSEAKDTEKLTVFLFHTPEDSLPLATTTLSYAQFNKSFPVTVTFPTQKDQSNQQYYIKLETKEDPISVYGRSEDDYPTGTLYFNQEPQPADIAFRASYDYNLNAILGDAGLVLKSGWLVIPLLLLLWMPGMLVLEAIEVFLRNRDGFLTQWDLGERIALAVGLSLAINPLLLLWTSVLGLHWRQWSFLLITGIGAVGLGILRASRVRKGQRLSSPKPIDLALLAIFLATLAVRLAMVRDLPVPAWVDPVHHTTIARLISETGAFQSTYAPYASAPFYSYHPGFHGLTASFSWLAGLSLDQAMLILGQVLNALMVPAVYSLAKEMTRSQLTGLLAAYLAAFFTLMPAYYTSWGRYTQLTGLLMLPVCATLIMRLLHKLVYPIRIQGQEFNQAELGKRDPEIAEVKTTENQILKDGIQLAGLAALASAGLFLVHYRVVLFMALLIIAFFTGEVIRSLDKQPLWRSLPKAVFWITVIALAAILLSLPWWPDLVKSSILPKLAVQPPNPQPLKLDWGYLTPVYGKIVLWLAVAGLLIAIGRAAWFGPVLALWIGLLLMSANQGAIRVPLGGAVNLTSVEIMLFMPVSILAGYSIDQGVGLLHWIIERLLHGKGITIIYAALGFAMLAGALSGSQKIIPIINPNTLLFRQADRPAMIWIDHNIPQNAIILINPFLWGYGFFAGADGGYWITPMTGRNTMPPTLLYASGPRSTIQQVNRVAKETLDLAKDPSRLVAMLKEENIQYVYIGRRGGALSPKLLDESGLFRALYQKDGVWIFEVNK